jgi:RNase adaptor protein for sRNA GlmZ degradation
MAEEQPDIVIITGLSGAGRSTAAKSLEDLGWFVVDNLPPGLLPTMADLAARTHGAVSRMAAVVDVRSRGFTTDLKSAISDLGARGAVFVFQPHLVAEMEDHDLWMAFFKDTESNTLALMSEVRPPAPRPAERRGE